MVLRRCFPWNSLVILGDENSTTTFLDASSDVCEPYVEPRSIMYGRSRRDTTPSFRKTRKCTPSRKGGSKRAWSFGNFYKGQLSAHQHCNVELTLSTNCEDNSVGFRPGQSFGTVTERSPLKMLLGHCMDLYAI
jgi:hypothetical protein